MKQNTLQGASFFLGVFLVTGGTLALQIVQTRILSVMTWYYLAFLSIGIAMLGLASGALWVYRNRPSPDQRQFARDIVFFSLAFAVSVVGAARLETLVNPLADSNVWAIFSWIALIICLTVPFFFSGVLVSLFLTRSPYRVGWVYGIDMAGAAFGCFAALLVLDLAGGPTALNWIALAVAVSSLLFAHYRGGVETSFDGPRGSFFHVPIITTLAIAAVLGLITQGKMTIRVGYPSGTSEADRGEILFQGWNSFSRVALFEAWKGHPYSGASVSRSNWKKT